MAEETRALGYICPECGKPVYGERTRFALNAAAVGLVCGVAVFGTTPTIRRSVSLPKADAPGLKNVFLRMRIADRVASAYQYSTLPIRHGVRAIIFGMDSMMRRSASLPKSGVFRLEKRHCRPNLYLSLHLLRSRSL